MRDDLFFVVHSFMSANLKLTGFTKEIFASIFGFWVANGEKPVSVTYSTLRRMTGASQPSVAEALKTLREKGFLSSKSSPGKRNRYSITIDPKILENIRKVHPKPVSLPNRSGVKDLNHRQLANLTTTSSFSEPQKRKKGNMKESPLKVNSNTEGMTGGLPLVK